jgi:hypothetical protein
VRDTASVEVARRRSSAAPAPSTQPRETLLTAPAAHRSTVVRPVRRGARSSASAASDYTIARYRDGMARKTTTVRLPEDLAETAEAVARGRGTSVNALVVDALVAEIERVKADKDFMAKLRALTERDKEILDRLAE